MLFRQTKIQFQLNDANFQSRKMINISRKPIYIFRKFNVISRKSICIDRKINCMSRKPIFFNQKRFMRRKSSFRFVKPKFIRVNSDFICEKSTMKWYSIDDDCPYLSCPPEGGGSVGRKKRREVKERVKHIKG